MNDAKRKHKMVTKTKKHERRLEILRATQRSKENIQQLSLQFQIINSMCLASYNLIPFIFEKFPD